jgi:hypothetical protein
MNKNLNRELLSSRVIYTTSHLTTSENASHNIGLTVWLYF